MDSDRSALPQLPARGTPRGLSWDDSGCPTGFLLIYCQFRAYAGQVKFQQLVLVKFIAEALFLKFPKLIYASCLRRCCACYFKGLDMKYDALQGIIPVEGIVC